MRLLIRTLRQLLRSNRQMIIQIPLASFFGQEDEMSLRDKLVDSLDIAFQERNCGVFDGTDTGMGNTNLYIYEIPFSRWEEAFQQSMNELKKLGLEEKAKIARGFMNGGELEVVWPSDYVGEFSVL